MSRDQNLRALKSRKQFDLLVIGGGITGLGIAFEAQSRGLQTCLVEAGDFAQESSGKSSKMVHGGLRYLEQAFSKYDYQNFRNNWQQMKISIIERNYIMQQSQSAKQVPILIPTETFGQAVWIYMGSLLFQFIHNFYQWKYCSVRIAWKYPSLITQSQIKQTLPSINNSFQYAVVTYDAQNDDSEHCIDLAQRTTQMGGVALNYCKLDSFKVDQDGAIQEAVLQDVLSQCQHKVQAKAFINCTGAFADKLRLKAEPKCQSRLKTAQGSHISLDQNSILKQNAIVNFTKFSKGFINFMIYTWQNQIIVGTTASMAPLTSCPVPKQLEVERIISELKRVTNLNSQDIKVKGGWAGIQPILMPGKDVEITKDHKLEVLPVSKLISVFTTRYSTYHFLAQKTVDYLVSNYEFNQKLDHHQKDFSNHQGFQEEKTNLKQDILNSINTKFAVRACDYIMRRGERIGLKDRKQTHDMINQVVDIMSEHFKWNQERKNFEYLSVICEVGL